MQTIHRGLNALVNHFQQPDVRMTVYLGAQAQGLDATCLTVTDLETLLQDNFHNGWLSREVILGALRSDTEVQLGYVINPNV
jgi:hypothetical protein